MLSLSSTQARPFWSQGGGGGLYLPPGDSLEWRFAKLTGLHRASTLSKPTIERTWELVITFARTVQLPCNTSYIYILYQSLMSQKRIWISGPWRPRTENSTRLVLGSPSANESGNDTTMRLVNRDMGRAELKTQPMRGTLPPCLLCQLAKQGDSVCFFSFATAAWRSLSNVSNGAANRKCWDWGYYTWETGVAELSLPPSLPISV